MRNSTKYSVIVPFYNAEKTLERCLNSLETQIRDDIEVILVNDGSYDNSVQIALKYVARNSVFQLISQNNAGVSCARNTGIKAASGQYITFVDSDDYVKPNYFEVLDRNEDCDLLVFCHEIIGFDPRNMPELFRELKEQKGFENRLELLMSSRRIMSPWDKRFKKAIIDANNIQFPEGMHIGEDFNFCMSYVVRSQDIQIETEQIICNDITGTESLSRKYRPFLDRQIAEVFDCVAKTIRNSMLCDSMKDRLLIITDYLFVKHSFSCILEELKIRDIGYFKERKKVSEICKVFRTPIAEGKYNSVHRILRVLLRLHMYFPFYFASQLKKKYGNRAARKEMCNEKK